MSVVQILNQRREGKADTHKVALVIEGGGAAGSVSAGMCLALQAQQLINCFDLIVGVSAGAVNGMFTSAAQAEFACANYEQSAVLKVLQPKSLLRTQTLIDMDFLFDEVIALSNPIDYSAFSSGPPFVAGAVNMLNYKLEPLDKFTDRQHLLDSVRASCSLPFIGQPHKVDGIPYADGGLLSPIPYDLALQMGATHCLVLRSHPAHYTVRPYSARLLDVWKKQESSAQIKQMMLDRPRIYNEQNEFLHFSPDHIDQVITPPEAPVFPLVTVNPKLIREGVNWGVQAMYQALGLEGKQSRWLPVIDS